MPRIPYNKPALTYQEQLAKLLKRGLVIEDTSKALFLLEHLSYFRLSGYFYPFLQNPKSKHQFKQETEIGKSDEYFIKHFKKKYSDPDPPCWIALEIASMGTISYLFQNLNHIKEKRDIANHYGLDDTTFASWLHCLVYIRNICAHHNRLWNRLLRIAPRIPRNARKPWLHKIKMFDSRRNCEIDNNNQ